MVDKRPVVKGRTFWQAWLVAGLGFGKILASKLGDGRGKMLPQVRSLDGGVSAKPSSEMRPAPAAVVTEPEGCARRKKSFLSWRKIGINNKIEIQSTKVPEAPLGYSSSSSAEGGNCGGGGGGGLSDSAVASVWRKGEGWCLRGNDDLLPESRPRAGSFPPEPPEPVTSMALLTCREEAWVERAPELEGDVNDVDEPLSETPPRLELRKTALAVMMATATHKTMPTILAFVDGGWKA